MEPKREKIQNEELKAAIKMMAEDNNSKTQNDMIQILLKARLILPVKVSPAPMIDKEGNYIVTDQHKITFATVRNYQDTRNPDAAYFIAFTDNQEYRNWAGGKKYETFVADFQDYALLLLRPDAVCQGFVINPAGGNVCFTTDTVKKVIEKYGKSN